MFFANFQIALDVKMARSAVQRNASYMIVNHQSAFS